jgi:hypothetical protein
MLCGGIWNLFRERKEWNNGICPHCKNGNWKSFDTDSSGATGYKCENCNSYTWISWESSTKKFIKFDIKFIRKEKIKKLNNL